MLQANIASLLRQTDGDYEQSFLIDAIGVGVPAANARLAQHSTSADYVWCRDDDDLCIYPELVATLKRETVQKPPVVILRMDHGALGILPDDAHWQRKPVHAAIGMSAFVVRGDVWNRNCHAFASGNYHADYDFISHVWDIDGGAHWVWLPIVASAVQRISRGEKE